MAGPAWLSASLAALMLLVAAVSAARLAIWRLRHRQTESDTDGLHVLMGVAMAGMLEPALSPVPAAAWSAVFGTAAAWFTWQAIRVRSGRRSRGWMCAQPAPHAVECAAMIYMLLPGRPGGRGSGMAMPGMIGPAAANPAVALILALFMLGYILWTADQLTVWSRARAAAALAPRLAACYKIVMSMAMGYMLIGML